MRLMLFGLSATSVLLASVAIAAQDRWISAACVLSIAMLIVAQFLLLTRAR